MRRVLFVVLALAAVCIAASFTPSARPARASTEHCFRSTHAPLTLYELTDSGPITLATTCTVPFSGTNGVSDWRVEWGDGTTSWTPSFDPRADGVGVACFNDPTSGRICFPCTECPLIGAHRYDLPGVYTVNVYYEAGPDVEEQTSFTATVLGLGPTNLDPFTTGGEEGTPLGLAAVENVPFNGLVAVFNGVGPITDFTATIDWGDGGPNSAGAITAVDYACDDIYGCSHAFEVRGAHLYTGAVGRTYTVTTTVKDRNAGSVTIPNSMIIRNAEITAAPRSFDAVALRPFSGAVADLTDGNPAATVDDYTATIDWGDGGAPDVHATFTANGAAAGGGRAFTVNGKHSYGAGGTYTLTVTIKEKDGATKSVNTGVARVTNPVPSITSASPGGVKAGGSAFTLAVDGVDFVPGARIRWNGVALPAETTTRVSATRLTALVPDANFATAKTAQISVLNPQPGGGASGVYPFFVTAAATSVTDVDTATSTGGHAIAAIGGSGAGSISVGGTGAGTVAVARYAANPGGTPSFRTGSVNGAYFDAYVAPGGSFGTVTITDCALGGGSQAYWWNGTTWVLASNQNYNPSTGCVTITVTSSTVPTIAELAGTPFGIANQPPTLTIPGDQTATYDVPLSAPIDLSAKDAEPGDHLTFTGSGLPNGLTLRDNGDRTARVSGTPTSPAGVYHVTVSVSDGVNPAVSKSLDVTVKKNAATLSTATATQLIAQGRSATLSATLKEEGGAGVAGRTVTLALSGGEGSDPSCTATSDASGVASCTLASVPARLGPQTVTATFAGDGYYLAASAKRDALIFAYLAEGAFVLGDRAVATAGSGATLTWWGNNWSSLNALSGGAAPESFKGFAAEAATPPACGTTWTSRPGNSAKPPASVPAYMAVAVTNAATSSGSTLSGTIRSIVIVKTGAGYGPDPGKPGTGTVVATLCSN